MTEANQEIDAIDVGFEDITDLQNDIDAQMNSIFQEFGGDSNDTEFKITIKRIMPGKGQLEHCFSCIPSELPVIDRIKNKYGPGSYEIWIYRNGKIFKRPKLNIAKEIGTQISQVQQLNSTDQNINLILQHQNDRFLSIERMLQNKNSETDPMIMMSSIMSMSKELMSLNNTPSTNNPMEMMTTMIGGMIQMKDFMESFNDGITKNRDNDDSFSSLIKGFIPSIAELTKYAIAEKNNRNPTEIDHKNNYNETKIEDKHQEKPNEISANDQQIHFSKSIGFLSFQAQQGKDPALYADLVIDNYPRKELLEYINIPNILDELSKSFPEINTYKGWFKQLIDEIKTVFDENDHGKTNHDSKNDNVDMLDNKNEQDNI